MGQEEKEQRALKSSRDYYARNSERILAWHRENYKKKRHEILARNKAWAVANPERVRQLSLAGTNRRKARQLGVSGFHTEAQWLELLECCGSKCVCCGDVRPLTRDHIVPLVRGGSDDIENIQPLCRKCNSSKGTQIINYLLERAAGL